MRFNARIGSGAELHRETGLGLHREAGRPIAGLTVGDDAAETFNLGAVLTACGAISACHHHQALAVQAVAVVHVKVDTSPLTILRHGFGTARNGGQAA